MNRIILIPLAGSVASILAIALAHGEKEGTPYPIFTTPSTRAPVDRPETPPKVEDVPPKPAAAVTVTRYLLEVMENGSFQVSAVTRDKSAELEPVSHESLEDFLQSAAPEGRPQPTVHVYTTSAKVTTEDLEKVATQLRARCEVVIQTR